MKQKYVADGRMLYRHSRTVSIDALFRLCSSSWCRCICVVGHNRSTRALYRIWCRKKCGFRPALNDIFWWISVPAAVLYQTISQSVQNTTSPPRLQCRHWRY